MIERYEGRRYRIVGWFGEKYDVDAEMYNDIVKKLKLSLKSLAIKLDEFNPVTKEWETVAEYDGGKENE